MHRETYVQHNPTELCQMQNSWLSNKANDIHWYADREDPKNFYDSLKEIYDSSSPGSHSSPQHSLIHSHQWQRQAPKAIGLIFWQCTKQTSPTINDEANSHLLQVLVNEMPCAMPTFEKMAKAIRLLSSGKAHDSDSILAEVYKEGGRALTEKLHQLFQIIWAAQYSFTRLQRFLHHTTT